MTLPISLRPPNTTDAPRSEGAPRGLSFALPIKIGTPFGGVASRGQVQVVAIATAAAMDDPADALALARLAREKPEDALPQKFNEGKVEEIVAAVRSAQEDPSKKIDPTEDQRETAAAVGANARLVAAAGALMDAPTAPPDPAHPENNTRGWNARRWVVALGKADLLDRAARAAIQAHALDPLDPQQDVRTLQKKITDLEASVAELKQKNAELQVKIDKVAGLEIAAPRKSKEYPT